MRILYGIQGTGNGHLSRAKEFIPHLRNAGQLDLLVSGTSSEVSLPHPILHRKSGLSYTFGKKGGIDYVDTAKNLRPIQFIEDVRSLDLDAYDMIITDFEPITAWAAKLAGRTCFGLSHQAAFLSSKTPRPSIPNPGTELLFKNFAPCTHPIGLHYERYDEFIWTPIIRSDVRSLKTTDEGHLTVYLPAYGDDILLKAFQALPHIPFHVFSKHSKEAYRSGNVWVRPVRNDDYLTSLASCHGLISGGGFEAPAEALFLGKRMIVIPMKDQFEQKCNAEALKPYGIRSVDRVDEAFPQQITDWLSTSEAVRIDFPDQTREIVAYMLETAMGLKAG
ncbi:MAG: hypothetical protein RL177_496 [Bacteroidota bacterium]